MSRCSSCAIFGKRRRRCPTARSGRLASFPSTRCPTTPRHRRARASSRCSAALRSASAGKAVQERLQAVYHVHCEAHAIEERARAIAVEQSVEMPLSAVTDDFVRAEIVGRVESIAEIARGQFDGRIPLAPAPGGHYPGQLLNMLFGNPSLPSDVMLADVAFPPELVAAFGGPRHGLDALRRRVGAPVRALTCSPLKPQGLPP